MKRIIILITIIVLMITLAGYNHETTVTQDIVDKTVAVNSFHPKNYSNKIEMSSTLDFAKIYQNIDELYEDSQNVVYGKVKEIAYIDDSRAAITSYNFLIENSYKGSLKENDMISVLAAGGYVRLQKFIEVFGDGKFKDYSESKRNQTVIEENVMGAPLPQENEKYLLFLSDPIKDESPLPDGAYSEIGAFMGRYYDKENARNGNTLSRYVPKDEPNFYGGENENYSLSEFENILQKK